MTPRMIITVTEEMHQAFKKKAMERGATMSGLARLILAEWLKEQGENVEWQVGWGRLREDEDESDEM